MAEHLADSPGIHSAEKAVALDPSDADYRNNLASYYMSEQRADLAIPQYQKAVTLNPHTAEYWLGEARAFASIGASGQQKQALDRALEVDPDTPWVSRQAANAYFMGDDPQKSLGIFRSLLLSDPSEMDQTLQICWQATNHDIGKMSGVLPPSSAVYLAFLRQLAAEGNIEGAEKIWSRLITLHQPFDAQLATPYLEELIKRHDVEQASAAWNDLAHIDAGFRRYQPTPVNLVVNGGFEESPLNMGFDWRYENRSDVSLVLDTAQFHGGRRSLLVTFNGGSVSDTGLSQFIAVDPDTHYNFSAYVRADNIYTADGPEFVIKDAYSKDSLLTTVDTLGTTDWKNVSGSFMTGPTTDLALLTVSRTSGAGPIMGSLWIDDVVLTKE